MSSTALAKTRETMNVIRFRYVLKLAEHVRKLFPEDNDNHLFELETRLRQAIPVMAA